MAGVVRRAAFSLVPVAARFHGFSSLIPRSTGSSYSSVFQFRKGLFASCFLPFSTSSPLLTEAIIRKLNATPKESHNAHVEVVKTGDLSFFLEHVFSNKSTGLVEKLKKPRLPRFKISCLIQKGGFNCKVDVVVKFARQLKELKERVEPKAESVDAELSSDWSLTLIWETEDEITEIKLWETEYEGLRVRITCRWGEKFCKSMEFRGVVLDDQGQIAILQARISIDGLSRPVHEAHLDEFTGMLEKRGLNDGNLDFLVKYAQEEASCWSKW